MAPFIFSILLLVFLPFSVSSQITHNNISLSSSLTTASKDSWLSPSGDFAFGFQHVNHDNNNSPNGYLLCIVFDKIPERTVVWSANRNNLAPGGSTVQLTSDGRLVLTDPSGRQIWSANSPAVSYAAMLDTGSFMLASQNSSTIWQSFDAPTDTLLPTQILNRGSKLVANYSELDASEGRFNLFMQLDGNLVQYSTFYPEMRNNAPYWDTKTASSSGYRVVFNQSGFLNLISSNGTLLRNIFNPSVRVPQELYHRVTLDYDGVLRYYVYPKSNTSRSGLGWTKGWNILQFQPENVCGVVQGTIGSGVCGFYSVCNLELEGRPRCECPASYSLMDPTDPYGNCRANYTQGCEDDEGSGGVPIDELYGFEEIRNTDWPTSDYALLQPFTEEECRQSCLNDCMCAAAIFRSGDMCWKKKLPLSNGRLDTGLNGKALLKVRNGGFPVNREVIVDKKDKEKMIVVGSVLLGFSTFINAVLVVAVCFGFHFIYRKKRRSPIGAGDSVVEPNLMCFTYTDLDEATNGFKEELGRGAFGVVYKGTLQNGVLVAVKKLNSFGQDSGKEFKNEVSVIGQTHHKNLVRLIGYCEEGKDRQLLVYEFLSNGTLADYLFREVKPSWGKRIQIALGISRGILYLHEECSTQVIHCDIKPQNILLDDHYTARISDFGLAKLLVLNQSQTQTAIRGTKGYVAPEWFRNSPVTVKVDVYSFGVLLLEIISCRRSVDANESSMDRAILTYWAYDRYSEGAIGDIVEYDMEAMSDGEKLEKYVKIAIWCIQEDPSVRPTMKQVWQMLEGLTEVPVPPCPTPYTMTITKD
ncbi:G-type lectin S-receptor-like serine/threonine-protein kinase LECRK2 [Linum perenne]